MDELSSNTPRVILMNLIESIENHRTLDLLQEANEITLKRHVVMIIINLSKIYILILHIKIQGLNK